MVSTHEQLKSLMQARLPVYDIHVSYEEPAHAAPTEAMKPARFHFLAEQLPGARFVLDSEVAAQELPMADRGAREMAESRCEQLLRKTAQANGVTDWVTMMLREAHEGMPTLGGAGAPIEPVAAHAGPPPRPRGQPLSGDLQAHSARESVRIARGRWAIHYPGRIRVGLQGRCELHPRVPPRGRPQPQCLPPEFGFAPLIAEMLPVTQNA